MTFRTIPYVKSRYCAILALVAVGAAQVLAPVRAQELEPRAYANTPVGMKFFLTGYGHNEGNLLFDPGLPIEGAKAVVDIGLLGYAQAFSIGGMSAKLALIAPIADLHADGFVYGAYRERDVTGFADPTVAISINVLGAPAMKLPEFRGYRQDTIVGVTLKITPPLGQYDADRLINIGTNRWSVKPEIGISKALGRWIVEGAATLSWQSTNDDFFNGGELQQKVIYALQTHLIYSFQSGWWTALDANYYAGGQTALDGVEADNRLHNWRIGLTMTAPLSVHNSLKFSASSGIITRTGTDFDSVALAWQYRWGGGLQ